MHRSDGEGAAVSWEAYAWGLKRIGQETEEWAGVPMVLGKEQPLVIEPRYPYAQKFAAAGFATISGAPVAEDDRFHIINRFWSHKLMSDIIIFERDGKRDWDIMPGVQHLTQDMETLGAADAWSLETEFTAIETLRGLVSHRQMRQYLLTGSFIESSRRSGLFYIFRRLRPTVALTSHGRRGGDRMQILAALCLHPIAHYAGSWAGALCPTDDVIAHLMLMRGDEKMFWRRANQHPPYRPEAGL